jgi:hypothetical protein
MPPPAVFVRPPPGRTRPDRQGRAKPLLPGNRSRFLKRVDALLSDEPGELGPGSVSRAVRRAQREFVSIPDAKPSIDGRR